MNDQARFYEGWAVLDQAVLAGVTTEQNTGYVDVSAYDRVVYLLSISATGTTLDADVEAATDASATGVKNVASLTQLASGDDSGVCCIDVDLAAISHPSTAAAAHINKYQYLNLEVTPSGSCSLHVIVFGRPRNAPASTSTWLTRNSD